MKTATAGKTAIPAVLDREQLVALARLGHMPILPSLASWVAMASEDRRTLIEAVKVYGQEQTTRQAAVGAARDPFFRPPANPIPDPRFEPRPWVP